jgi:NAD(P)-dependent dehydrogenase (short-subunit alcohol dehydrogenase family)
MSVYDLTGRRALVTGGARGLGEGMARAMLVDIEPADVRRMLDVNVLGTALGIKHGFRAMRPGGPGNAAGASGGAIVNVASVAATIAFPGIAGYSATKSAVDRLTRVAAMECGGVPRLRRRQVHHRRGPAGRRRHGNVSAVPGKWSSDTGCLTVSAWW